MPFRYTDVNTRSVWDKTSGLFRSAGLTTRFWKDAAGTLPVDVGLYNPSDPETPGASIGGNSLTVQGDSMWPAMWDREGAQDHMWVQTGTSADPGDLFLVYCDADQRLDALAASAETSAGAQAKADAAQAAAIVAAASDATAKASAAQAAAVQRANHAGTQSADTVTDGTTNKAFLATERTKLAGIATAATANSTDAQLRDRSTHTGTQAQSTVTNLTTDLAAKVGKGDLVISVTDAPYSADPTGVADSTTAILAATAATTVGARVFYPPGTYTVSASVAPKTGTTHFGVRGKSIIKVKDGVTGFNVFQPAGTSNVQFEDLIIDLNKANTTNPGSNTLGLGIYMAPTSGGIGFAVRRVEVKNGHQIGIRYLGHTGQTNPANLNASEVTLESCYVHDCSQQGIMAVNTTKLRARDCVTSSNGADGIFHSTSRDTVITDCTAEDNGGHGIVVTYAESCKVVENTAKRNSFWGIAMGGGSTTINPNKNYIVEDNIVSANLLGGITNDPTVTGAPGIPVDTCASISGNISFNNGGSHGIYVHNTKNVAINDNVCFGNANSGVAVHGLYSAVTGNVCFNNTIYGISIQGDGTEVPTYGHHRLGSNVVYGNGTADYHSDTVIDVSVTGNPPDVQELTATGTWTKPFGAQTTRTLLIGPGGSSASGRKSAAGVAAAGGGSGAGGGLTVVEFVASDLPATVAVTIGAPGTPGAAQATNSTDGVSAAAGTNTTFGSYAMAMAGGRGFGGTTTAGTGGTGGGGTSGGMSGGSATATAAGTPATNNSGGGGGGGSGGSITSGNVATNGAAGGTVQSVASGIAGAGGVVDSTAPTSGTAPTTKGAPGPGAGGGAASTTGNGQDGAAGVGYGSGAGGGGAARDGVGNSGAGKLGGPGYALVISRY